MKQYVYPSLKARIKTEYMIYLLALVFILIADSIGQIEIPMGPGKFILFPIFYALILGIISGPQVTKIVKSKQVKAASKLVIVAICPFIAKLGINAGASLETVVSAGPALISDMYGPDSPEAQGSLSIYIVGGMVGTIYFGFLVSVIAMTNLFHPYALGMASGVGAGIMMASATASLSELYPAMADQISALASASETISGIDGIYMAIFLGIPLCNWLYKKLEPKFGRFADRAAAKRKQRKGE